MYMYRNELVRKNCEICCVYTISLQSWIYKLIILYSICNWTCVLNYPVVARKCQLQNIKNKRIHFLESDQIWHLSLEIECKYYKGVELSMKTRTHDTETVEMGVKVSKEVLFKNDATVLSPIGPPGNARCSFIKQIFISLLYLLNTLLATVKF